MPKVFVTRPIPDEGIELLRSKGYEVVVNVDARDRAATRDEVLQGVKDADALLSVLTEKIDDDVLKAGPNLKIVALFV